MLKAAQEYTAKGDPKKSLKWDLMITVANGMSEHDVMVLAGHASFAATHELYLAVADDLMSRAKVATAQGMRQKVVRFGTPPV